MKKWLVILGLLFLCQQFIIHVCDINGRWLLLNAKATNQPNEGFTEDSSFPIIENTSGSEAKPVEPPAFTGANVHIFKVSKKDKYSISMYYPTFGKTNIDNTIKQWVETFSAKFAKEAMADPDCGNGYPTWATAGTYSISQASPNLLSVFFRIYQYTGGAHGDYEFASLIFDMDRDKLFAPADLFADYDKALRILSQYCRKKLAKIEEVGNTLAMQGGTEAIADNFSILIPRPGGVLVVFPAGQVSCFAAGTRMVLVPWGTLREAGALKVQG